MRALHETREEEEFGGLLTGNQRARVRFCGAAIIVIIRMIVSGALPIAFQCSAFDLPVLKVMLASTAACSGYSKYLYSTCGGGMGRRWPGRLDAVLRWGGSPARLA